jgi:hypothetical protein
MAVPSRAIPEIGECCSVQLHVHAVIRELFPLQEDECVTYMAMASPEDSKSIKYHRKSKTTRTQEDLTSPLCTNYPVSNRSHQDSISPPRHPGTSRRYMYVRPQPNASCAGRKDQPAVVPHARSRRKRASRNNCATWNLERLRHLLISRWRRDPTSALRSGVDMSSRTNATRLPGKQLPCV